MKRAPIVAAATAAGLAGVLAFHTSAAHGGLISLGTTTVPPTTTPTTTPSTTPTTSGTPTTSPPVTTPTTTPTTVATATRTAVGDATNYSWGVLSVQVTATGKHITNVTIASLDDGGNQRSAMIDQQSIPILESQALAAQSANIQGVSGASYTSAGFAQSLQSALTKLGI